MELRGLDGSCRPRTAVILQLFNFRTRYVGGYTVYVLIVHAMK